MNFSFLRPLMRSITLSLSKGSRLALGASLFAAALTARAEVPSATPPPVDHYVYLRFLPKASELAQDAQMNHLTILRIDETADRVIVSYQYPDGHTATLGYALIGTNTGPSSRRSSASEGGTARYTVADRDPEVVYVDRAPARVVYYSDPYYPYYYNYWAPLTVGFGLGWATSYYSGGHYYYHGGGGHYHGGGHGGGGHGGGSHGGHGHR